MSDTANITLPPASSRFVTWAGAPPYRSGHVCLGTDDGRVVFLDESGRRVMDFQASDSGEAVNGVAIHGGTIVVATRADLTFFGASAKPGYAERHSYDGGVHGVEVTRDGLFIAPAGNRGVIYAKWEADGSLHPRISDFPSEQFYSYRAAVLNGPDAAQLVMFAGRRHGIGFQRIVGPEPVLRMSQFSAAGLDVVDVCSAGPNSFAAVALMRDGALLAMSDARDIRQSVLFTADHPAGTAYRVHSQDGHLFILTSKALIYLHNAARELLSGGPKGMGLAARPSWMQAVDISRHSANKLLVVRGGSSVGVFDFTQMSSETEDLVRRSGAANYSGSTPTWTETEVEQVSSLVTA